MTTDKRLILNADDLGFSPAVNRAILQGACEGYITAASLMVNMPFAEQAAESVRDRCPGFSLALHFCLTAGRSAAEPESIPLLVDDRGMFRHGFLGLWRSLRSEKFREQARTELLAQLDRADRLAERYSLRFDHLDSHQHIHVLPGLLEPFREEAARRGLTLRIPREHVGGFGRLLRRFPAWFPQGLIKRAILNTNLGGASREVGYFGILDSGKIGPEALEAIVRCVGSRASECEVFEINVHPSLLDAEDAAPETDERNDIVSGDRAFHASPWRRREFEALRSPAFRELLEKYQIRLVGFGEGDRSKGV